MGHPGKGFWFCLISLLILAGLPLSAQIFGQRPQSAVSRPAKPQRLPNRWAVVIGISRYQNLPKGQQLQFADADAQAFYDFIRSPRSGGFPVKNMQLLLNEQATTAAVRRYLGTWLPRNVEEGDIVYIYYAGHGVVEPFGANDRAYWVTHDADPQDLNTTAVPMEEVKNHIEKGLTKAGQVVFITDCCRAEHLGSYQPRGRTDEVLINRFLEEVGKAQKGFLKLLASRADQPSIEDPRLKHGVFTNYLLEGLKGEADTNPKDQIVRVGELISYLEVKIPEVTNYRQHPRHDGNYDDMLPLAILEGTRGEQPPGPTPPTSTCHFDHH